jgi:hypothetical protein
MDDRYQHRHRRRALAAISVPPDPNGSAYKRGRRPHFPRHERCSRLEDRPAYGRRDAAAASRQSHLGRLIAAAAGPASKVPSSASALRLPVLFGLERAALALGHQANLNTSYGLFPTLGRLDIAGLGLPFVLVGGFCAGWSAYTQSERDHDPLAQCANHHHAGPLQRSVQHSHSAAGLSLHGVGPHQSEPTVVNYSLRRLLWAIRFSLALRLLTTAAVLFLLP